MTRKYTKKAKKKPVVEQKTEIQTEIQPEITPVETESIEDLTGLPNRDLFRINEVASYFSVSDRTIRLWIDHGHFQIEKLRGTIWVPRSSILKFRLKSRVS